MVGVSNKFTMKRMQRDSYKITFNAIDIDDFEETGVNAKLGTDNHLDVEMDAT